MSEEAIFREPTELEKAIVSRLLEADFPGKSAIQSQLSSFRVRQIDAEGSLELRPARGSSAAVVTKRIPVEAEGMDQDGTGLHILLHVVGGFIKELEIYKDDGSSIKHLPNPNDLTLMVLSG